MITFSILRILPSKFLTVAAVTTVALLGVLFFSSPTQAAINLPTHQIESFAACGDRLFGFPSWHQYICEGDGIRDIDFEENPGEIWLIGVAILEILIRAAGVITFFFLVYSGLRFVTSQGDSQGVADARRGLIGSLIGLGIAIIAVGTINYLGNAFGSSIDQDTFLPNGSADDSVIARIGGIFVTIVGALSVVYGVIGAFRYVYGAGDAQQVSQAKRTIVYAIIGLIISILAGAIISFALGRAEGVGT